MKLDVTYNYGDDSLRFVGHEPLGPDDLRTLQGLVAMSAIAGENGRGILLHQEPATETGLQLRLLLDLRFEAAHKDSLVVKGSFRQLARELGYRDYEGGKRIRLLRESIRRLYAVTVFVKRGNVEQGFRILSEFASEDLDGRLLVALNPRITEAVLGQRNYTRIEMQEVRSFQSDTAALIHQRLSGWIDPGKENRITTDTLVEYAWPVAGSPNTTKMRRRAIKRALGELEKAGWKIQEYAPKKWRIIRPEYSK